MDAAALPTVFARAVGDYESAAGRARWTRLLLGLTVALHMLSLLVVLWERALLDNAGQTTVGEWRTTTSLASDLAWVEIAAVVVTGVVFLNWLYRCYQNVHELGFEQVRFTPGWAVGYWLIPILNVWRPRQIIGDLWRSTDPDAVGEEAGGWRDLPLPWTIVAWWVTWYGGTILLRLVARGVPHTLADLKLQNLKLGATHGILVAAAALAFWLVGELTSRQDAFADGDFDDE